MLKLLFPADALDAFESDLHKGFSVVVTPEIASGAAFNIVYRSAHMPFKKIYLIDFKQCT